MRRLIEGFNSCLKIVVPALLLSGVLLVGYWGWLKLKSPTTFPIRQIKIISPHAYLNLQSSRLQRIVRTHLTGGFFSLNIKQLRTSLLALPWVEDVALRRKWPETLVVVITEKQPLARWGANGLLTKKGLLFYPPAHTIPQGLPLLQGPEESKDEIFNKFNILAEELKTIGLGVRRLQLSKRLAWYMVTSNGIHIMMGRQNVELRFEQFVELYPRLIGDKAGKVAYVDLRYPNGLAIKWRVGK